MEKYARQAVSEGITNADDIRVGPESEILRVLNLHYNRNNHIDVSFNIYIWEIILTFEFIFLAGSESLSIRSRANS